MNDITTPPMPRRIPSQRERLLIAAYQRLQRQVDELADRADQWHARRWEGDYAELEADRATVAHLRGQAKLDGVWLTLVLLDLTEHAEREYTDLDDGA